MKYQYKAKSGAMQWKPSFSWIMANSEEFNGFCLACGEEQEDVEPDACKYECDSCGRPKVYGAEQLALMGLFFDDTKGEIS